MAVQWPVNVPTSPLIEGYSRQKQPSRLVSNVDAGARKRRQRFTAVPQNVSETFVLTSAQRELFEDWYEQVALNGAETFIRDSVDMGIGVEFRFADDFEPEYTVIGIAKDGPLYSVQLELETVPA